jgi:hypothetical protein
MKLREDVQLEHLQINDATTYGATVTVVLHGLDNQENRSQGAVIPLRTEFGVTAPPCDIEAAHLLRTQSRRTGIRVTGNMHGSMRITHAYCGRLRSTHSHFQDERLLLATALVFSLAHPDYDPVCDLLSSHRFIPDFEEFNEPPSRINSYKRRPIIRRENIRAWAIRFNDFLKSMVSDCIVNG